MSTDFHARYWAELLNLRSSSDQVSRLTNSLSSAKVDLNPHQVDAALFMFRSPLSKGVILADEVGLGKTIEAGLVITQRWAERKRKILLVVPTSLRKQWQQELGEKFFLPTMILEADIYNSLKKDGDLNPFDQKNLIVVCSYHFAVRRQIDIAAIPWDLVVMDEAHRLRNVYKSGNVMGKTLKQAVRHAPKLLLTATPLQNSLLELYGLVSLIDDQVFGDIQSFRQQFLRETREDIRNEQLRARLRPLCKRTLRKQVLEYVPYTKRASITQEFYPTDAEQWLYEAISQYLQRKQLHALPSGQRQLMTLILRKLLASSSFAITGTLQALINRLEELLKGIKNQDADLPEVSDDMEIVEEMQEEWPLEEQGPNDDRENLELAIQEELTLLRGYAEKAMAIRRNAKGEALLTALEQGFHMTQALGAQRKAVIFTESLRTQKYLFAHLTANGYAGQIVLFNGGNQDALSRQIYAEWLERHDGKEIISGSKTADMRAALVEEFRERATILLATESAAEGINLQFCSQIVNYDLPWNPQRIEQRIGRCHRYGQKHDVVVINFLNKRNAADQRVYELLSAKFRLFDGLFGSSDEVLGALESGVDFERRIADIYQSCRTTEDIQIAFDQLQQELEQEIADRMAETRRTLLENFDEDVHQRLKFYENTVQEQLSVHERILWWLAKFELADQADFSLQPPRFYYRGAELPQGYYHLNWREAEKNEDFFFRREHPLAQQVLAHALERDLPVRTLQIDYSGHGSKISAVQELACHSGWLALHKLTVESLETEDFLIVTGQCDDGYVLDEELCTKLLELNASTQTEIISSDIPATLRQQAEPTIQKHLRETQERNSRFFEEEMQKLDGWAEDLKMGLEREIKEIDAMIRERRKGAALSLDLESKVSLHREIKDLEKQRNEKRRHMFDAQDEIDTKKEALLGEIEQRLRQQVSVNQVFAFRWQII